MYIHGILHLEMIILWLISCKLKIILKQTSDIIEQHSGPIRYEPPPTPQLGNRPTISLSLSKISNSFKC